MEDPKRHIGVYIPAFVLYDEELNDTQRIIWGLILSLSDNNGYAYASNAWFSGALGVSGRTISRHLSVLAKKGYINREQEEGDSRKLYPIMNKEVMPDEHDPEYEPEDNTKEQREEAIDEVLKFWRREREDAMGLSGSGARMDITDRTRRRHVNARLEQGYTVEDLKKAVLGCLSNDFNVERGFTGANLIFRNQEKVEQYLQWFRENVQGSVSPRKDDKPDDVKEEEQRGEPINVGGLLEGVADEIDRRRGD